MVKRRLFLVIIAAVMLSNAAFAQSDESDDAYVSEVKSEKKDKKKSDDRAKPKENAEKKTSDYVSVSGTVTTSIELGLVDGNDDADEINVTMAKNRPVFTAEADVFAKLLMFQHENIIFGPVAYSKIEGKMNHRDVVTKVKLKSEDDLTYYSVKEVKTKELFYFKKGDFFNYAGIKIGTTFGKAAFAGSKFTFTVPFMVDFICNDANDYIDVPSNSGELDYFSHLVLGTNLITHLQLKSKPYHFGLDIKNQLRIGGDIYTTQSSSLYAYELLYLTVKNDIKFAVKPFNFISNKVDVELAAAFKSSVEFTGRNLELKKKAYFGIKWDGLKYFALGYKPFIYSDENNYLSANLKDGDTSSYDNKYNFSTEVSVSFGNKYFDVEIAYEPSYYIYDDSDEDHDPDNADALREHKITTAVKIKF